MDTNGSLQFDFDFGGESRQALLAEAGKTLAALDQHLGDGEDAQQRTSAELDMLRQLDEQIAEFGDNPQLLELKEKHFELYGWQPPKHFHQLKTTHRFYWMRVPILFKQLENMPFSKLKLGLNFNPNESNGNLRPISMLIFPDKKVKQLVNLTQGMVLKVGENFDFEVATGKLDLTAGDAKAKADAGINASAGGNFGLTIGPFNYDLKTLELDHTDTGLEKVFWSVNTAKYLHEEKPTFIVVIQVPRKLKSFEIVAAMQATHQFDLLAATPSNAFKYFRSKVADFFRKGAPIEHAKTWSVPLK